MKKISLMLVGVIAFAGALYLRLGSPMKTPDWMYEQIHEDLSAFTKEDLNPLRVKSSFENLSEELYVTHIQIKDNQIYWQQNGWDEPVPSARTQKVCKMLSKASKVRPLPDVSFLITMHDGLIGAASSIGSAQYLPIMTFAKTKAATHAVLIPDPLSLEFARKAFKPLSSFNLKRLKTQNHWAHKFEKAFWRGGTTGGDYLMDNWHQKPRTQLALLSQYHPEKVDAGFSTFNQMTTLVKDEMLKVLPQKEWVDHKAHLQYKYLVIADGNTCTYPRFLLGLYSGSVVFKDDSNHYQWFYKILQPNTHYVSVKQDFSDLPEKVEWAKAHDKEMKKMAKNSREMARKNLSSARIYQYIDTLLNEYAHLQDSDIEVDSSMHTYTGRS